MQQQMWLDLSDIAYASLLSLLQATFNLGETADGRVLQRSIRSMHEMDKLNQMLAASGFSPGLHFLPSRTKQRRR
jgi:hypothetical protein